MRAIILAGGKGTRLRGVDDSVPKPLIKLCGRPVIFRQIDSLLAAGCERIYVIGGHLGEVLRQALSAEFADRVELLIEPRPLGTGGCLSLVREHVVGPTLVVSGDLVFDMDLGKLLAFHVEHAAQVTISVHPNNHPRDSDLVVADGSGRVSGMLVRPHPPELRYHNLVNASIAVMEPAVWDLIPDETVLNLERDVFQRVKPLWAYRTPEYIKDMGTPDRLARAAADLENGVVEARSLRRRQKAVFLDRDGVINRHKGYIVAPDQIDLLPGVIDAIRQLNHSTFLTIVVTNQPQIARNLCTLDDFDAITREVETQLGDEGARLDDQFFCPHHPDAGFPGENVELKIKCACRKPEPGMLLDAAARYNIDLADSYMIGDSWRDLEAGKRAGTRTILVDEGTSLETAVQAILQGKALDSSAIS